MQNDAYLQLLLLPATAIIILWSLLPTRRTECKSRQPATKDTGYLISELYYIEEWLHHANTVELLPVVLVFAVRIFDL